MQLQSEKKPHEAVGTPASQGRQPVSQSGVRLISGFPVDLLISVREIGVSISGISVPGYPCKFFGRVPGTRDLPTIQKNKSKKLNQHVFQ